MPTIKIKTKPLESAWLLRILIAHPMETGRRRDEATGALVPAHFIQEVAVELNGAPAAACRLGPGVSKDPYLSLRLRGARAGDRVRVSWTDNQGRGDSEEIEIA